MRKVQNHNNVPTITNLVATGDPRKKAQPQQNHTGSSHLDELNQRIDEIEDAIGQDNTGPVGRAFAIRAESNNATKRRPAFKVQGEIEKTK